MTARYRIPFNRPHSTGQEHGYIGEALQHMHVSGNGPFTKRCQEWLQTQLGCHRALLTHSCTGALEMAAILADIGPGDEVIMPSFTFVSTANAFVLRGGVPVFVDIRPDTLNLDERLVAAAVTDRTKAIVPVHYGGVACEMDSILATAREFNLTVIEDAAHGLLATYKDSYLGVIGHLGTLSFHETKNVISGEGGALLVSDPSLAERAEIIWEKGTNRSQFFRGEVDKYTWVDVGSSFLPSDITAAFLWAQIESIDSINQDRNNIWMRYHQAFSELEQRGLAKRPVVPEDRQHSAHVYFLLLPDMRIRDRVIRHLKNLGILAVFHYVPLHSSPAGIKFARPHGDLSVTTSVSERLVRLPLWIGMDPVEVDEVVDAVYDAVQAA